jgi:citrate/tricarballylate utilization protein
MNTIQDTIAQVKAETASELEASRILTICNACRYCEGFCAVFPAMTRRLSFDKADVHYLANLCHNCGACLHACQYAPPHEFAVNVPAAMAELRTQTYADYAWPAPFGKAYKQNGLTASLSLAFGLAFFLMLTVWMNGSLFAQGLNANFYAIFPHNLLAIMFGSVFGFAVFSMTLGARKFWREVGTSTSSARTGTGSVRTGTGSVRADSVRAEPVEAFVEAATNALTLKYLDGNNNSLDAAGCTNGDDAPTQWRRRFHHAAFYGFMLCFASTSVATLYHYLLGLHAPYALTSLPVILGVFGGIGLIIGTAGLALLQAKRYKARRAQPLQGSTATRAMDMGFIALLFFTSLTGLALLAWREAAAMPLLLAVHLGVVMALFLTLPYGKMAHGVYRSAALLKFAIERRKPNHLAVSD